MSDRNAAALERWIGIADVHRDHYRIFCVLAGVLNPAFGMVYQVTSPEAFDPLWARYALGVSSLLLISLSYMSDWVKDRFILLTQLYFYFVIVFYVGLTVLNSFAPDYVMGMLFVITAVGIVFGLGLKNTRPLAGYLGFCVMLVVPSIHLVPSPQMTPAIVSICVVSISTVIFVATRAKIQAEEEVEASELRYRMLMNGANDAIFIIDPEAQRLLDANDRAQELIGRNLIEIRRMDAGELYPQEKREEYLALIERHVSKGASFSAEFDVAGIDGRRTPVDVSASLITIGDRSLIQGIFRDATERHQYEKQLIEAKNHAEDMLRLKTSFLNNMSHEIRTPLTSILGFSEVLGAEVGEEQREFVTTIRESAKRLHQTLNSVLDLAQLESGKANVALNVLEMGREVQEVISVLQPLADQKKLMLRVIRRVPNVWAELDQGCLNRILNNLVGNAVKFTEEGHVTVEVDADEERVFLRVRDTGIGISDEFQRHLFNEFRQESTGISRSYEGNGLGLAITKRLVDLMHGSIHVDSIKGLGSTFTVQFPRVAPKEVQDTAGEKRSSSRAVPSLASSKILVIEDNPATRFLIMHRLGQLCHVEMAASPEDAYDLACAGKFDLLLIDINLTSQQNGVDVLRDLRALPGYANIPAVAMTVYSLPGDREHFLEAGFDYYLSKPFTLQQLLDLVEQAICANELFMQVSAAEVI